MVTRIDGYRTDHTGHRSGDGAVAQVHASTVGRCLVLRHRCLRLLVLVLGVVEHVLAHDFLLVQVLVALILQLGTTLLRLSSQQVGLGRLQLELGIAAVDTEQHLPFLDLLTFGDAHLHQLTADLRRDRHVGRTLEGRTVLERNGDVALTDRHGIVRSLHYLGDLTSAGRQQHNSCKEEMFFHSI